MASPRSAVGEFLAFSLGLTASLTDVGIVVGRTQDGNCNNYLHKMSVFRIVGSYCGYDFLLSCRICCGVRMEVVADRWRSHGGQRNEKTEHIHKLSLSQVNSKY